MYKSALSHFYLVKLLHFSTLDQVDYFKMTLGARDLSLQLNEEPNRQVVISHEFIADDQEYLLLIKLPEPITTNDRNKF